VVAAISRKMPASGQGHFRVPTLTSGHGGNARRWKILFAHLKRHLGFRRLKLRGLDGATEECLLAATVQNLKKLIKLRPPDTGGTCLPSAA